MFRRPLIALDIGPGSVKALQLKKTITGLRLTRIGIEEYPRPLDPRSEADRPLITQTIKWLLHKTGFRTKKIILSIPRYYCFMERIELPTEDEEKIDRIINLNLTDYIPLPANRVYFSHQIIRKGNGRSLVLLVACKREVVEDYLSIVKEAGLIPVIIDVSSQAILNATLLNYPSDGVVAIFEARQGRGEMAIISKGELLFSRGFLFDTQRHLSEIQRSFDAFRIEYPGVKINRLILSGEGTNFFDLKDLIERELDFEVEVADPLRNVIFDHPKIQGLSHSLMLGIGLAIRVIGKKGINLLPPNRPKTVLQGSKILIALPSLVPLILLLITGLLSIDIKKKEKELKSIDQRLMIIKDEVDNIRKLKKRLILFEQIKNRIFPLYILKELNQIIPENIWLTGLSIEGNRLQIQGQGLKDSDLADLLQALNSSPCFKETTLISSSLVKLEDQELIDFQIDCQVLGHHPEPSSLAKEE